MMRSGTQLFRSCATSPVVTWDVKLEKFPTRLHVMTVTMCSHHRVSSNGVLSDAFCLSPLFASLLALNLWHTSHGRARWWGYE